MARVITTNVVSGFPAIGKSFLAKKFPVAARDLESSDYHWLLVDDGKVCNPQWPANYIEAIKALDKSGMYRVICTSSHDLIRSEMANAGIRYTNLAPEDTPEMKQFIIQRCKDRGSPEAFIKDLEEHYSVYVQSMINDKGATRVVQLNKHTIFEWDGWAMME